MARFFSIISGSHSVGKTTLAVNLAAHLQAGGKRPLLLTEDTNWPAASSDAPHLAVRDLNKLIAGRENLATHIVTGPLDINFIALRLAREPDKNVNPELIEAFCQGVSGLAGYDYFILDIAGGLTQTALSCCLSPCDSILVATPEPRVLNQTLRLVKVLSANGFHDPLKLVVTQSQDKQTAEETYVLLEETAAQQYQIPLEYIGYVGRLPDEGAQLLEPDEKRGEYFGFFAALLDSGKETFYGELPPEIFWARMLELLSYPLQIPPVKRSYPQGGGGGKLEISLDNSKAIALLEKIVDHLGAFGGELARIRKLFESEMPASGEKDPVFSPDDDDDDDVGQIIPLDLEAFSAQMNSSKTDNDT